MRVCVWIAIAGACSLLAGCGGVSRGQESSPVVSEAAGAAGRLSAQLAEGGPEEVADGGAGPSTGGALSAAAGAAHAGSAGAMASAAGAPSGGAPTKPDPGPGCTGAFSQLCPSVDGCLDTGKRTCVGGKWSECKCLDECKVGEGRECVTDSVGADGVQLCGDDRQWQACYAAPTDWPAHALCHFPASKPDHIGASESPSAEYPVCILSCFFAGDVYREDKMQAKTAPLSTDHCVQQPSDMCWRCP